MQTTAVYACVRILAEAIAGLPENVKTIVMVGVQWKAGRARLVAGQKKHVLT